MKDMPETENAAETPSGKALDGEECLPIDPGCLPAWDVDEMPRPIEPVRRNLLALIGPGLVLAGGSIGTGEWVMGPQAAARYQGAMLWVALFSIVAQVILNTEVLRYTLCTGEPILTGFLRCKPGPRFWLIFYLILDFGGWLPSQASLAAQILVVAWKGLTVQDTINTETVRLVSVGVFLFCAILPLFGGKIYNTLQVVMGGKFAFLLGYTLFCALFYVSMQTWIQMWGGLFDFTRWPKDPATGQSMVDWSLVAALTGFAGVGGLGNIMVSNFAREKGWGMGGKVGAIASAFGGHKIELSHIGTMARPGPTTYERFKGWYSHIAKEQYGLWALGSLAGMMLPCLLGAQYLNVGAINADDQWRWAAALAQDFGAAKGEIFRNLTFLCGLIIFIPGQFYNVDITARRWTDAFWSGSSRLRKLDSSRVKHVYYTFAGAYVLWCLAVIGLFPGLSGSAMMKIAGNAANLAIAACIFHTLYVNRRFLPKPLQPSPGKQVALVLSGSFFLVIFGLVFNQKILPVIVKAFGG
jgi:hypothetical protein